MGQRTVTLKTHLCKIKNLSLYRRANRLINYIQERVLSGIKSQYNYRYLTSQPYFRGQKKQLVYSIYIPQNSLDVLHTIIIKPIQ